MESRDGVSARSCRSRDGDGKQPSRGRYACVKTIQANRAPWYLIDDPIHHDVVKPVGLAAWITGVGGVALKEADKGL